MSPYRVPADGVIRVWTVETKKKETKLNTRAKRAKSRKPSRRRTEEKETAFDILLRGYERLRQEAKNLYKEQPLKAKALDILADDIAEGFRAWVRHKTAIRMGKTVRHVPRRKSSHMNRGR